VESFAKDLTKFNIKKHHLLFYGLCNDCSEQQENNKE
jgi:Fe2+ or Zn2+ uptake regulation protein